MEEECFHMNMKDFGFYKGVDLGGWFSQCDYSEDRMDHFITEKDFQVIAGWGLDHVRIPVDYNVMETENGGWRTDGFRRIGKALEYAGNKRKLTYGAIVCMLCGLICNVVPYLFVYQLISPLLMPISITSKKA